MATVLESFGKWKEFLSGRVAEAEKTGINDQMMVKLATEIGDFLANKVDPENPEQRVLKELWDAADQQEQQTIARLMVKLVR